MIELKRMTEAEFQAYLAYAVPNFAREKMKSEDLPEAEASAVAEKAFRELLPDGLRTDDHALFSIIEQATGDAAGIVWVARKRQGPKVSAYIYDIELAPAFRGKGYGKHAMRLLEDEVKRMGLSSIRLHVFGHNLTAIGLYQSSGYRVTNQYMAKDLA